MSSISKLKEDMDFYKSLGSLIGLLKMIAITQYHSLEKKNKTFATYLEAIESFFYWLDMQKVQHPFVSESKKTTAIIAITSDAGLLGGYNAMIMNEALTQVQQQDSKLIIIGKRGRLYVEKHKMVFAVFPGISQEKRLEQALQLRDYIVDNVLQGKLGPVKLVFSRPLSFTMQRVEVVQVLPFVPDIKKSPANLELNEIILESKFDNLVEYLLYLWLGQKIFEIFGLSNLAEQAARFMHLEFCTQRIKELDKKLKLKYFRAKHEIVDQNMRELFASRMTHEN
ncbi:MAG: hypothetical protein GY853_09305 [PVC group bacterium]|nr:hypothetical protein [PVC group bacterium]